MFAQDAVFLFIDQRLNMILAQDGQVIGSPFARKMSLTKMIIIFFQKELKCSAAAVEDILAICLMMARRRPANVIA